MPLRFSDGALRLGASSDHALPRCLAPGYPSVRRTGVKLCSTHANVHKGSGTLCSFALPIRQPLLLVRFAALFAMKREIEEQLTHAIAQKQRQTFVTEDALVLKVREYLADELTLTSALRSVSVIDNQADRLVMLSLCAAADLTQQLEIHSIQQLAPLDITIIHKTIEHVLLTTEQAA